MCLLLFLIWEFGTMCWKIFFFFFHRRPRSNISSNTVHCWLNQPCDANHTERVSQNWVAECRENSHNHNNKKILHHSNMIMCCRTVYLRLDLELRERCSRAYLLKHTECSISIDQINIEWQAGYVWSHSEGGREGPAITAHYPHITIPMWVWCLRRGVLIKLCLPEWQQRWRGRQQSNWGRDCVASPGWSPCGTGSASQSSKCTDLCKGKKE